MAYDNGNIFAKILRGEAKAHVVLEDAHCMAFLDVMPQSVGHTLVIPREPAESLFDIGATALSHLIETTQRVARGVKQAFNPGGVTVMQLNGTDAGQTVFHIHFHVIPRYPGVKLDSHAREMAPPEELAKNAAKLRAALAEDANSRS